MSARNQTPLTPKIGYKEGALSKKKANRGWGGVNNQKLLSASISPKIPSAKKLHTNTRGFGKLWNCISLPKGVNGIPAKTQGSLKRGRTKAWSARETKVDREIGGKTGGQKGCASISNLKKKGALRRKTIPFRINGK